MKSRAPERLDFLFDCEKGYHKMKYGYFDDARREYVITNPKTPVKWINYIGTLKFGGFVDQTGGGLICKGDPALNRITRYIPQTPASDFKGETLYLRIHTQTGYRVLSPLFVPGLEPLDRYECRIGLGYSHFLTEVAGLRCEMTVFVPREGAREVRDISITNLGVESVRVDAVPVIEYTHPDALKQFNNADWVPQTMQSRAAREPDGKLILIQYPFMLRDLQVNYFTANLPVDSFETDRARFLGDHEYGSWAKPLSLFEDSLSNYEAQRGDNIAALLVPIGELAPGESRRLITQLGQEASLEAARVGIDLYHKEETVQTALAELADFWDEYLGKLQVETPDPSMETMLNIHNPRQCFITRNWSRYLSLYQPGLGTRGIGVRDSSQDVLSTFASAPDEARALIKQLTQVQKWDGSAMHQFNPMTMEGSIGDAAERDDRPHYYSDDHLWMALAVVEYIKETGDRAFLSENQPYYEKDRAGRSLESKPLWDHLTRALDFTRRNLGSHGLPHLGFADWNDTINLAAGAESLFSAYLYGKALQEITRLARATGNTETIRGWEDEYQQLAEKVNEYAWDGDWYAAYFDADGSVLGSHQNEKGQIYVYSQAWAVMSGFAPHERAEKAMQAVYERLNTRYGVKLSAPGYNGFDPTRGGITTYPPGAKENGGIFLHTNPWVMIAETMLGHGDRAYQYYCQINPAARNEQVDLFEVEPYVYPQNILGDEHPQFGLGRNSWLSGTASWAYLAATQYILGIRPELDGLRVDPCLPTSWDGYKARRVFRKSMYWIDVRNPQHVCKGVRSILVDGHRIEGCLAPIFEDGKEHRLVVELGN